MRFRLEIIYDRLQALPAETLVRIIDEALLEIQDNEYKDMAHDVYTKAKSGINITHKQKRVLVNIICQP